VTPPVAVPITVAVADAVASTLLLTRLRARTSPPLRRAFPMQIARTAPAPTLTPCPRQP